MDRQELRETARQCGGAAILYAMFVLVLGYILFRTGNPAFLMFAIFMLGPIIQSLGIKWSIEHALGDW